MSELWLCINLPSSLAIDDCFFFFLNKVCIFSSLSSAIIGPPSIALHSHEGNIEVSITDPEFSIKSLREVYGSPSYNITYWRDGEGEKEGKEKVRIEKQRDYWLSGFLWVISDRNICSFSQTFPTGGSYKCLILDTFDLWSVRIRLIYSQSVCLNSERNS